MVSLVTDQLQAVRDNANEEFNSIFKKVSQNGRENGKILDTPRIVSRQTQRSNVESNTPEEYYRRSIFIPFIDCLINQLKERFTGKNKDGECSLFLNV